MVKSVLLRYRTKSANQFRLSSHSAKITWLQTINVCSCSSPSCMTASLHFYQELIESILSLIIAATSKAAFPTPSAHCINLINKHNRWRLCTSLRSDSMGTQLHHRLGKSQWQWSAKGLLPMTIDDLVGPEWANPTTLVIEPSAFKAVSSTRMPLEWEKQSMRAWHSPHRFTI